MALAKCCGELLINGASKSVHTAVSSSIRVVHVGRVGKDGEWLKEVLQSHGVDVTGVEVIDNMV